MKDQGDEIEIKDLLYKYRNQKLTEMGKRRLTDLLRRKQVARVTMPDYRDKYRWTTIRDSEINFLLDMAEKHTGAAEARDVEAAR